MSSFRIISFDGGGIKGALSARILKRLCDENENLIEKTNLFAGTSTGALIALALASDISPAEIDKIYNFENLKKIFSPKHLNIFKPKFNNKNLKKIISTILPKDATLQNLKKQVFIPYFPSHNNFIDGGIITNSPAITSVITVIHELPNKYKLNDFKVLSIGTGETPRNITSNTSKWGILQWSFRPFSSVKLPLTSILLNDTLPLENLYAKELLKENFKRINSTLPYNIEIDDYTKVDYLKNVADKMDLTKVNNFINDIFLK